MKKFVSFIATIAAVAALSACSQDDGPVLQKPTEFKLNTPPFAEQLYQLENTGDIQFTCSQPDYGLGTETTYGVEISLTEDFANPKAVTLANSLSATLQFSAADVNLAILDLLGVVDEETWAPYADNRVMPLYVRATAQAAQVEYSKITSNVVKLPKVEIYFAIKLPAYIYLIGSPSGWNSPSPGNAEALKDWRLFESEQAIGSNVYSAVFTMPAQPTFRFYTALTEAGDGWEANYLGCPGGPNADTDVNCELTDGVFEGSLDPNTKDKFFFPDFQGGEMTITVDLNTNTIKVQAGAVEVHPTTYIYICGNMASSDWTEPSAANQEFYDNWRLSCSDGSGVYTATFNLDNCGADALCCRFYQALTGWGAAQWASPTDADYEVTSGVAADSKVGEGCFQLNDAKGKNVSVEVDTNTNKVKFTFVE